GCALINNELADSYQWVLHQTKQATRGYVLAVIMTVADPALNLAISKEYEQSYLIKKYNEPRVVKYLKTLYSSKKAWVCAYTTKIFTAGIQLMPRVESYNTQVKRLVLNSNISLLELAEVLEASLEEEIKKAKYACWKTQIPLISSAATLSQTLFPNSIRL
ncbi:7852_t:CDS:2, partial [Dentiscutata erythropus]